MSRSKLADSLAPGARVRGFFVFALGCLVSATAAAHDLWLVPGSFRLSPGETTRVFINNGDVFPESLSLLGEHRILEMKLRSARGETTVSEFRVDGKSLTFELHASDEGSQVLALATHSRRVRLKAVDFNEYLEEEGLARIAELREELGEAEEAAIERYAKWAKAVVDVGDMDDPAEEGIWSEPVGHTIEILPSKNPNSISPGDELSFRVVFQGEPLAGASIVGARAGGSPKRLSAVTDAQGLATVIIPEPGRWYLRTIHMIHLDADPQIQWDSFWGTLTFEVRDEEESRR